MVSWLLMTRGHLEAMINTLRIFKIFTVEGERASAHDDDALAPELQVPQLVGVAVADVAPELVLVPVDDVAPLADAAVHGEHHELAPHPIHGNWLVAIGRSPLLRHGYDQNNIRHSALSKSLMIITIQK